MGSGSAAPRHRCFTDPDIPPHRQEVAQRMWSTFDRTRRRLLRVTEGSLASGSAAASEPNRVDPPAAATVEVVIAIGRPELDRLGHALQALLGNATARPDTPDRLEAALAEAIASLGASGRTRVARRPAGLYTPEAWQVHLIDAEPVIELAIRRAIREGVFAA